MIYISIDSKIDSYDKGMQFYDIMRQLERHFHNNPTEFAENFRIASPAAYF
jgi:hypothetical protein